MNIPSVGTPRGLAAPINAGGTGRRSGFRRGTRDELAEDRSAGEKAERVPCRQGAPCPNDDRSGSAEARVPGDGASATEPGRRRSAADRSEAEGAAMGGGSKEMPRSAATAHGCPAWSVDRVGRAVDGARRDLPLCHCAGRDHPAEWRRPRLPEIVGVLRDGLRLPVYGAKRGFPAPRDALRDDSLGVAGEKVGESALMPAETGKGTARAPRPWTFRVRGR